MLGAKVKDCLGFGDATDEGTRDRSAMEGYLAAIDRC